MIEWKQEFTKADTERLGPHLIMLGTREDGKEIVLVGGKLSIGIAGESTIEDWWDWPQSAHAMVAATQWSGFGDPPEGWVRTTYGCPVRGTYRRRTKGMMDKEWWDRGHHTDSWQRALEAGIVSE